jgi:transposase InsO family protein
LNVARSTLTYKAVQHDDALRLAMMRLAKTYGRYGYRKITQLLQIEGWKVNHKRIERLWREEGLQLPQRHKKRKRLYHKDSSVIRLRPQHSNHIWSIDFVHDKLTNGRSYKMLTVIDEYTREALCVAVRPKMKANDVLDVLFDLILKRGKPRFIRSDNGPEFIADHLQTWLRKVGIEPIQIYPGSPWECGGWRKQCGTLFSRHMATTSASMARYAMKCSTQNGSTLSIKRKLQSMCGSDNTITSDHIMD